MNNEEAGRSPDPAPDPEGVRRQNYYFRVFRFSRASRKFFRDFSLRLAAPQKILGLWIGRIRKLCRSNDTVLSIPCRQRPISIERDISRPPRQRMSRYWRQPLRPISPDRSFHTACGSSRCWGEFGRSALQTRDIEQILQRATELCAQGLETRSAKSWNICRTINGAGPRRHRLVARDARPHIYWDRHGIARWVRISYRPERHLQSSPGRNPVSDAEAVVGPRHQADYQRPNRAGGEGHLPFGVLEVDSPDSGQFDLADANFLADFAGLLRVAIERQHADADLRGTP
jgi:hypothetical protein